MSDAVREINHAGYLLENNHITLGEFNELIKPWRDAAPIRRGRWIDPASDDCYRCSVCEEYTQMEMPRFLYHYCPNCGAEMEIEE